MKYYLSSYRLGNETEKLAQMMKGTSGKFAYIPNALDFTKADPERRKNHIKRDTEEFQKVGGEIEVLDLKDYFGKQPDLRKKLLSLGGVYISAGNSFVLRQAMKISGFDSIILEMSDRDDFIYAGYSAAVCVLCPTLTAYAITDDATDMPYAEIKETIWDGIGILDFVFEPHYDSDHPESESTDKELEFCIKNKILFKAYRDGEVLVID